MALYQAGSEGALISVHLDKVILIRALTPDIPVQIRHPTLHSGSALPQGECVWACRMHLNHSYNRTISDGLSV